MASGAGKGAASGATYAVNSEDGGTLTDKVKAAGVGAVAGGLTGGAVKAPVAKTVAALALKGKAAQAASDMAPGALKSALSGTSSALSGAANKIDKIGTKVQNVVGPAAQGAVNAGVDQSNQGSPSTEQEHEVDVDALLHQLGIDPKTPDGTQKAQQVSPTDFTDRHNEHEDGTPSEDVPQIKIVNGKKVLTTPSGETVELN
jgi:hypothetical protein